MKAFLLAAGHGSRLRPLTDTIPKCLVPIRGIPMLQIWLDICRHSGIDEVLINLHAHANQVEQFVRKQVQKPNVHIVQERELLGSAGTVLANKEWVKAEDEFWIFYADVLTALSLDRMQGFHRKLRPKATLGVYRTLKPSSCGIIQTNENGIVTEFIEKPKQPKTNMAFAGVMIGTPALIDAIPNDLPADFGFHVLPTLIGEMAAFEITDYLLDIGTLTNYELAQKTWPRSN